MNEVKFKSVLWLTAKVERQCFNCEAKQSVVWEVGIALDENNYHYILPVKNQPYHFRPPCALIQYIDKINKSMPDLFNKNKYAVIDVFDVVDSKTIKITTDRWNDINMWWKCHKCNSEWALTWATCTIITPDGKILFTSTDTEKKVASEILVLLNGDCNKKHTILMLYEIPHYLYDDAINMDQKMHHSESSRGYHALNSIEAGVHNTNGVAFLQKKIYDKAIDCFNKVIEIEPNFIGGWVNKGTVLMCIGEYSQALSCYDKAIALDTKSTGAWYAKGELLRHLKKNDEAIECYNHVINIDPEFGKAWFSKGTALMNISNFKEAVTCFEKSIVLNNRNAIVWYNMGIAQDALNKYSDALKCFDEAVRLNPLDIEAWYEKGRELSKLHNYKDAIKCFDKVIQIDSTERDAWHHKGLALKALGKHKEAADCFDKIGLNP